MFDLIKKVGIDVRYVMNTAVLNNRCLVSGILSGMLSRYR
jgi:hypothetical protein